MVAKAKGGRSSSTQMATRGSRASALPFSVSAPVLNTMSPTGESAPAVEVSSANQIGATWGRPSARTVASFPVWGGRAVEEGDELRVAHGVGPSAGCAQAGRVGGRPSLRWSHETVRSTWSLATIRLLSMVSTNGRSSSV